MRCKKVRDLISPYLDQMTDEKESHLIEEHLSNCLACQEFMAQMRDMCKALKITDWPVLPAGFAEDFHQRLQKEAPRRTPWYDSRYLRPLILKNAGTRFKGEMVRFYHWRNKTVE